MIAQIFLVVLGAHDCCKLLLGQCHILQLALLSQTRPFIFHLLCLKWFKDAEGFNAVVKFAYKRGKRSESLF